MHFYHHHHYYHRYYFLITIIIISFWGVAGSRRPFKKTTVVKDNVKVNIIMFYFFLSDVRTLFSGISPVKNMESYKREL